MNQRVKVGVIGCGAISSLYLDTMTRRFQNVLEVVGCSSKGGQSAREQAARYGLRAMTNREMLEDRQIELVVVLTPPASHEALAEQALLAGKHVYCEKTLAMDSRGARRLVALAREQNRLLCCAPDTLLSAGVQTARAALEKELIGAATSCVMSMNRDYGAFYERLPFLLQPGAGIGADLGPYFIAAAVYLLGPVASAAGMADVSRPDRLDSAGQPYRIENENRFSALLRFASGVSGVLHLNGDAGGPEEPCITIYGTKGVIKLINPNKFCRQVLWAPTGEPSFRELPLEPGYTELLRGAGVAEMAAALRAGRRPFLDGAAAAHAVEVIEAAGQSARSGSAVPLWPEDSVTAGPPFDPGMIEGGGEGGNHLCQDH